MHMWSCNTSSRKFSLQAPSVCFLTPRGHFGTQASHHSYSSQHSELFAEESFPKEGEHCPDKAYTCSWIVQQQKPIVNSKEHPGAEPKPSAPKHLPHTGNPEHALMGGTHSKVVFCATVHGGVWSSSLSTTSQVHFIFGLRYKMGQTKGQVQLLHSGT